MKKILLSVLMITLITLNLSAQFKAFPNPSVAYIEKMGYTYQLQKDNTGNEKSMVIFPDGTKADGWAFLQGKTGVQYSYCAKHGYNTISKKVDHGTW